MNQHEIVQELIGIQNHMVDTSPEEAMLKRASEADWSVEILGKAAQVYNAARTADHFSKSASRGSDFPLVDVEALKSTFLEYNEPKPQTIVKAARTTHDVREVDLTREMSKAANIEVIPPIPEESLVDVSILDKSAGVEEEEPYCGMPRLEYIQHISNEAAIATGAYNNAAREYLEGIDKAAGYMESTLDISKDEHVARHNWSSDIVDGVVKNLQGHADAMHKELNTHTGELRKMAFVTELDSPINDLSQKLAEAFTLNKFASYIQEGMAEEEALEKASAIFTSKPPTEEEVKTEVDPAWESGNRDTSQTMNTSDAGPEGGEDTDKTELTDEEKKQKKELKKQKKLRKKEKERDKGVLSVNPGFPDAGKNLRDLAVNSYQGTKTVAKDGLGVIGDAMNLGRQSGEKNLGAVTDLLKAIDDDAGVHPDQEAVDQSVGDATRAIELRRLVASEPSLAAADPKRVLAMYNMLVRQSPSLAGDIDALKFPLKEAVIYDGLPLESIQTLRKLNGGGNQLA